jgi:DNA helicase II / ATP-dependent DNA helicase PcrA
LRVVLTREQRAVVESRARALVVQAGAGAGKTLALARRVARLAPEPADQARVLVVTFTREATASLQRRLSLLLGRDHLVRVLSFHQWAARELPPPERRFLSEQEARSILESIARRDPRLAAALGSEPAARLGGILGYLKSREAPLAAALAGLFAPLSRVARELEAAQEAYEARKGDRLDYDDVPVVFRDRLRQRAFRRQVAARLDHVLVDEYQDVNGVQDESVRLVCGPRGGPSATIVGDPRQSIYAFRGGSPEHLRRFPERLGRPCKVLGLTTNFRATRALVAAANRVDAGDFPMRPARAAPAGVELEMRACRDADEEALVVAERVQALAEAGDAAEVAVLVRARHHALAYADEARRRGLEGIAVRTIHAAKGLEWDHVILLGAKEGGLPSDHALAAPEAVRSEMLAEERRLTYVALTRARRSFLATWPGLGAAPSRFLRPLERTGARGAYPRVGLPGACAASPSSLPPSSPRAASPAPAWTARRPRPRRP